VYRSPPLTSIELRIRDLLKEAKSMLAARKSQSGDLSKLIVELLDCASRAKAAGFSLSEQKLLAAASDLERLRNYDQALRLGRIALSGSAPHFNFRSRGLN